MTVGAHDGWSVETLRQYILSLIDQHDRQYRERFEAQNTQVAMALAAAEKAVGKAETATERRFEGVNEFRSAMDDQQRLFLPRKEYEAMVHTMTERVDLLGTRIERMESKGAGASVGWGYAVGAVGLVAVVVAIIMQFVK
jgi:hypothetical protein